MKIVHLACLVLCLIVPLLNGCASGEIHPQTNGADALGGQLNRPDHIYVAPIDVTQATWKADAADVPGLQKKVKSDLEKNLVEELSNIAPTSLGTGSSGWRVVVTPTHVDPGSGFMRVVVGFGSGQSKILAKFSLYDLNRSATVPVIDNADVGADTGIEMGLHAAAEGNGMDALRIAREIKGYLHDQLQR
jgi:hypothetical protein